MRPLGLMPPPPVPEAVTSHRRKHLGFIIVTVALAMAGAVAVWLYVQRVDQREAQKVRLALEHGLLDEASHVLEQWLELHPRAAEAYYLKARLAWVRNDLPTVQQGLTRARELGYPIGPLSELRGLLLARTNQGAEAEPLLCNAAETRVRLIPTLPMPWSASTWVNTDWLVRLSSSIVGCEHGPQTPVPISCRPRSTRATVPRTKCLSSTVACAGPGRKPASGKIAAG